MTAINGAKKMLLKNRFTAKPRRSACSDFHGPFYGLKKFAEKPRNASQHTANATRNGMQLSENFRKPL